MSIEETKIREVLGKLRIKSGLRGDLRRPLEGPWAFSFEYDREHSQFVLRIHYGPRFSTSALPKEYVEDRSRKTWLTDATWRLSAKGLDWATAQVVTFVQQVEAREAAKAENQ